MPKTIDNTSCSYKILLNDELVKNINTKKYKSVTLDAFLQPDFDESQYDYLLVGYGLLGLTIYTHNRHPACTEISSKELVHKKIAESKLLKILIIHDLHTYTFEGGYQQFFSKCSELNITAVVSNYCDNPEFEYVRSELQKINIPVYVIVHTADDRINYDYKLEKIYDILWYGCIVDPCYAFRRRLRELLLKNPYNWNVRVLDYNELKGAELSKAINQSWLCIATRSSYDYFLTKYKEIALSHALIAADMPTQARDYIDCDIIVNIDETMTDDEIYTILHATLKNKQDIQERILKQREAFEYTQSKYNDYYFTLLIDRIKAKGDTAT